MLSFDLGSLYANSELANISIILENLGNFLDPSGNEQVILLKKTIYNLTRRKTITDRFWFVTMVSPL
jgi:hypothetical protein